MIASENVAFMPQFKNFLFDDKVMPRSWDTVFNFFALKPFHQLQKLWRHNDKHLLKTNKSHYIAILSKPYKGLELVSNLNNRGKSDYVMFVILGFYRNNRNCNFYGAVMSMMTSHSLKFADLSKTQKLTFTS